MRSSLWYRLRLSHPHLYPSGLPSKCQRALPSSFCSWFTAEMPFLHPASVRSFATGVKPQKFKLPPRYDPYGPRPPPSEKILRIADAIASLPPDELKQIGPCLREKLRAPRVEMLSPEAAAAMPQMGAASGPAKAEEKKPEKTAFDVKLEKFDAAAKIKVIKEVRSFTNLGLKEAKELVEKSPALLKQGVSKEEANDIIEKIKAAGGVAVME